MKLLFLALFGLISTAFAQGGGGGGSGGGSGGGGGSRVDVVNCTAPCSISECEADSSCATLWAEIEDQSYSSVDAFEIAFEEFCNTTEASDSSFDCDDEAVLELYGCIVDSSCWNEDTYAPNCSYYSTFELTFVVYNTDGSVSSDDICDLNWRTYVTNIINSDDATIRVSDDCDDSSSGEGGESSSGEGGESGSSGEGGEGGSGGGGSRRRILQGGEGGSEGGEGGSSEGGEGGSSEGGSEGGSGGGSGGGSSSLCAEETFSVTVSFPTDDTGDLSSVYNSFASELTSQASSLSDITIEVMCYETECCDNIQSGDSACSDYESSTCETTFDSSSYTCTATDGSSSTDDAGKAVFTSLIAFMTIVVALFGNN